jgi:16S rRNA (uracil1498-N3)-methyltransferase
VHRERYAWPSYNRRVRPRFHLPDLDLASGAGELVEDEASHLTRVLRLGAGAAIDVFDGRGGMFEARVARVSRGSVTVRVVAPISAAAEPGVRVTLVISVLKGDKMDAVVRDSTMMGVSVIQPIVSERSEISVAAIERGHRTARWTRIAVSSVKQSGRAVVPAIRPPLSLDGWLKQPGEETRLGLIEPAAGQGAAFSDITRSESVALVVGPEGGWTAAETEALGAARVVAVSLGPRTLRADVAPTVAMSALFEAWKAW